MGGGGGGSGGRGMPPIRCCGRRGFFSAEPTFFSRSDFFSDTVRDVRGEHREPPWQVSGDIMAKTRFRLYPHSPVHDRASALTSPP